MFPLAAQSSYFSMILSICSVEQRIMSAAVSLERDEKLSQNHKMVEVGRYLCRSSGPAPCKSRVIWRWLPRTMSRWLLNVSKEGGSNISG